MGALGPRSPANLASRAVEFSQRAERASWLRLLDDHGIEQALLYPTAMGDVSRIREPDYAVCALPSL